MITITISDIIFGFLILGLIYVIHKNLNLKQIIFKYKNKNPIEIDLELATFSQIMSELRSRSLKYIVIIPQFDKIYQWNPLDYLKK